MHNFRSSAFVLEQRLLNILQNRRFEELPALFTKMTNAEFRMGGGLLADLAARELSTDEYWQIVQIMVHYNTRAFLVTLIKGALRNAVKPAGEGFVFFCGSISANTVDVQKTCELLLCQFTEPEELRAFLDYLHVEQAEQRIRLLLPEKSRAAAYLLFHTLKFVDHDRSVLLRTVQYLIKRGDDVSYNFASLLTAFFGLHEIKATFSLRVEPFKLSWLEGNYDAFCKALGKQY